MKTINKAINTKPTFEAEGLGSSISGVVTTLTHKPLPTHENIRGAEVYQ